MQNVGVCRKGVFYGMPYKVARLVNYVYVVSMLGSPVHSPSSLRHVFHKLWLNFLFSFFFFHSASFKPILIFMEGCDIQIKTTDF